MEQSKTSRLFTNAALMALIVPIMIEEIMLVMVGTVDTLMVAGAGEAAVSGISLVDQLNRLLKHVFSAMAAGGTVVVSQYAGRKDYGQCRSTAIQLLWFVFGLALALGIIIVTVSRPLLQLVYGNVEADVMDAAQIYFFMSGITFPFLGIYTVGASLFRAMGISKVSMYTSFVMNIVNIIGNATFICGFKMGVFGAALSTLISSVAAALFIAGLLLRRSYPISIWGFWKPKFQKATLLAVIRMGVPNGIENSMFQLGKVLVNRLIASFGTAAIAANVVVNSIDSIVTIPSQSISTAMVTVVGQSIGAKDKEGARYYIRKMMMIAYLGMVVMSAATYVIKPQLIGMFHFSEDVNRLASIVLNCFYITGIPFWPLSFTLPNALRGAGDMRYTMLVSMTSMFLCRIVGAYLLGGYFGLGLLGVHMAMAVDWLFRGTCTIVRLRGDQWLNIKVID
jgi:putative MATE family efflux protein